MLKLNLTIVYIAWQEIMNVLSIIIRKKKKKNPTMKIQISISQKNLQHWMSKSDSALIGRVLLSLLSDIAAYSSGVSILHLQ